MNQIPTSLPGKINRQNLQVILERQEKLLNHPQWQDLKKTLTALPFINETKTSIKKGCVMIKGPQISLSSHIKEFGVWRKGPFNILGNYIDSEWRSDLKWARIKDSLPSLENKVVLDIGCNNGYFMFLMEQMNPKFVLGIDPVPILNYQFQFINHFARKENLMHQLLGVQDLGNFQNTFDVIFSMGILYHHRHPLQILLDTREALRPGGELIIETIGIPGEQDVALFPKNRYAKMKNVWWVPTLTALINMLERCQFINIQVITTEWDKTREQRSTKQFDIPSYEDFLDPNDSNLTMEGYPAPERFCLKCERKK